MADNNIVEVNIGGSNFSKGNLREMGDCDFDIPKEEQWQKWSDKPAEGLVRTK